MVCEKMVPKKNGPQKNGPQKSPQKIIPRQKNARKFERLFHFYQFIPLHTQKYVQRSPHDSTCTKL